MRGEDVSGAAVVWEAVLPPSVAALALPHGDAVVNARQKRAAKKKKGLSL